MGKDPKADAVALAILCTQHTGPADKASDWALNAGAKTPVTVLLVIHPPTRQTDPAPLHYQTELQWQYGPASRHAYKQPSRQTKING
jgi:hypothetical protein